MSGTGVSGSRVVVAAMGSEYRHDDGVGPAVADVVAGLLDGVTFVGPLADPLDLLVTWDGADLAVVADAVRTGAPPGTVSVIEITGNDVGGKAQHRPTSTHGIGLAGVLRLARITGGAPQRVVVVGIEGREFGQGTGLSPAVRRAVPQAARRIAELIEEVRACA